MNKEFFCHQDLSEKLYRIGVFSQMNRITVKTLRHYDEIGLLKPAYVDEDSGYRYYTSDQLLPLHKILALRDMGFSLEEIRQACNGASEEQLLKRRKQQLLKIMAETGEKLARVEGYLSGGHLDDEYRVILKSLPAVTIASMRQAVNVRSRNTALPCITMMNIAIRMWMRKSARRLLKGKRIAVI